LMTAGNVPNARAAQVRRLFRRDFKCPYTQSRLFTPCYTRPPASVGGVVRDAESTPTAGVVRGPRGKENTVWHKSHVATPRWSNKRACNLLELSGVEFARRLLNVHVDQSFSCFSS